MTQALYRRYRPVTFDEVIGQDHVTGPLRNALRNKRTHHAYLFSGPRGCGKTTSARILARCLNCEQGPTPDPCGTCQSCTDLGPGGGGSLDVIEIDAASHGGVDDARDLRERAFYAPASSHFKIYIIDEAHMVSREGFNALLKLVEEPPEHVMFVFATTEPDKVIATIRSRTHHYPFRLVPPKELHSHLAGICAQEGVTVDPAVLSLVVRAGRGSVRDSLSVLDQLLAGAGEEGLTYDGAAALLGYTPATLLDDMVEAFAAGDGSAVFRIVDQVVEAGNDPRRFAEDLLERLRDLIVIDAVPDDAGAILAQHPADELERMRQQGAHFGAAELSRAADIVNTGLGEMKGATAPRLLLELICARVLLPGADDDARGLVARLDRLERRLAIAGAAPVAAGAPAPHPAEAKPARDTKPRPAPAAPAPERAEQAEKPPAARTPERKPEPSTEPAATRDPEPVTEPVTEPAAAAGGVDLLTVRRTWPDVLEVVKKLRRFTWTLLSHNSQVHALEGNRLTLAMVNAGARDSFLRGGSDEIVRQALIQVLGVDWRIEAIVDPTTSPTPGGGTGPGGPRPAAPGPATAAAPAPAEDTPSADDEDADETGLSHHALLERELGAKVIGEYDAS